MQNKRLLMLVEIAIFATLAYVLDLFAIIKMPQGGSATFGMIPIFVVAIRWGLKAGIVSGAIFGFLQLIYGGYVVTVVQGIFEYIIAFAVLGFAGIFSKQILEGIKNANKFAILTNIVVAIFIACTLRFFAHVVAGVVWIDLFMPEGLPAGQSVWLYSLGYNLTYMLPSFIIAAIVCGILFTSRPKLILQNT